MRNYKVFHYDYRIKKQSNDKYKVQEIIQDQFTGRIKKRTIYKNKTLEEAEFLRDERLKKIPIPSRMHIYDGDKSR